jgi:hypothetical protein
LASNPELPWSEDLIRQFQERWKYHLARNQGIPWSKELIDRCADLFDWSDLPEQSSIDWSEELIDQHEDRFYWREFSGSDNEKLPWSREFIARYEEKWNWDQLSGNESLAWTEDLMVAFEDQWVWDSYLNGLSGNEALPWSTQLIETYKDSIDWSTLSENKGLPWSEELIARYENRWDFDKLSVNEALPWSEDLLETYSDRWDWSSGVRGGLSGNEGLCWTADLIARHEEKWNWDRRGLSSNRALPWSFDLLERHFDRWSWEHLSGVSTIPWSVELLRRYEDTWDWSRLGRNRLVYERVFADSTDDNLVQDIAEQITSAVCRSETDSPSSSDETSNLAQDRVDLTIRSMALVAHYVGGIDGTFDAEESKEAAKPRVLMANIDTLLYEGNPSDDGSVQAFIDTLSRDELAQRLSDAIEEVGSERLSPSDLVKRMESLSAEAKDLNGFLPLDVEGADDEERRKSIAAQVNRYGLGIDVNAHEDIDGLYESFDEAIKEHLGQPFRMNLAYALVYYGTFIGYASGSLFSSSPYSEQEKEAVQKVGSTFGLPGFDLWSAKVQAQTGAEAIAALTSKSFLEKLTDSIGL